MKLDIQLKLKLDFTEADVIQYDSCLYYRPFLSFSFSIPYPKTKQHLWCIFSVLYPCNQTGLANCSSEVESNAKDLTNKHNYNMIVIHCKYQIKFDLVTIVFYYNKCLKYTCFKKLHLIFYQKGRNIF